MCATPNRKSRPQRTDGQVEGSDQPSTPDSTTPPPPVKFGVDFKTAALAWAASGFRVVPCVHLGRAPLVPDGFAAASSDLALVRLWWNIWPTANIGVATGRGLVALRLGCPFAFVLLARAGASPSFMRKLTWSFQRPRHGRVYLFRSDAPVKSRLRVLYHRAHLRIYGEGDGVIVPPSRLLSYTYRFPGRKLRVPPLGSLASWIQIEPYLNGECK